MHNAVAVEKLTWAEANQHIKDRQHLHSSGLRFGPVPSRYIGTPYRYSKYMPHIGEKQRARDAFWPDGPMHWTPHEHRAFRKGD